MLEVLETFPRSYEGAKVSVNRRAPTIVDIAEAAQVSKTTVSRVLNASPHVAPATRARVLEAIGELGFQVNQAARTLRTSRTGLVGVLVPIISIFGVIVEALDRQVAEDGLGILLAASRRRDPERDVDAIEALVGRGVEALVLAPSDDRSARLARYLRSIRPPIVLLDREVRGLRSDAVFIDQSPGIHAAVQHFVGLGRGRIGLLTRDQKTRPGREIVTHFREACTRAGRDTAPELIAEFEDLDQQAGREGVDRLLEAGADALISAGTMAHTASVLERLADHGLRVPGDLALAAYGQLGPSADEHTRLPTVAYPVDGIARAVNRLVNARLAGSTAAPRVELVQTVFVNPVAPSADTG
jgi:LacI family transcriptional regulator, galactose operon repressor